MSCIYVIYVFFIYLFSCILLERKGTADKRTGSIDKEEIESEYNDDGSINEVNEKKNDNLIETCVMDSKPSYFFISTPLLHFFSSVQGPVNSMQMLRKPLKGTDDTTFTFGANIWTLHYLRLTNQLDYSETQEIFDELNVMLAAIMFRYNKDGSFKMWGNVEPSVWYLFHNYSFSFKFLLITTFGSL